MFRSFFLFFCLLVGSLFAALPPLDVSLDTASVRSAGEELTISTGVVEPTWRWTGAGLATISLKDLRTGKEWVHQDPVGSDWLAAGWVGDSEGDSEGDLVSLTAERSDDERFTTEHLRVRAEVRYSATGAVVRFEVWAYPGSEGLRTQLWLKKDIGPIDDAPIVEGAAPQFVLRSGKRAKP